MQRVVFDFDIISPYAYLAFERLPAALEGVSHHVEYRPLLFAGLLKHWGNTAPVDVAPKKAWLFRQCAWIAEQDGIVFRPPTPHPFNPLALLRLLVASAPAGGTRTGARSSSRCATCGRATAATPTTPPRCRRWPTPSRRCAIRRARR